MKKIGLVLAGGGISGMAFHAGALAGLAEATGWEARNAELTVGTSAGSTTGAMLRLGVDAADLVARATGAPLSARAQAIFAGVGAPGAAMFPTFSLPTSLRPVDPVALARALRSRRPNRTALLAAAIPEGSVDTSEMRTRLGPIFKGVFPEKLWVCAVRISDGELVVFGRDHTDVDPAAAIQASCAIPGFFKPVDIDGERYLDGGLRSMANADLVADQGLDIVIVSSPMTSQLPGPVAAALSGPMRQQLRRELSKVAKGGAKVIVIEPDISLRRTMGGNPMDPESRLEVTRATRESLTRLVGADQLDAIRQAI